MCLKTKLYIFLKSKHLKLRCWNWRGILLRNSASNWVLNEAYSGSKRASNLAKSSSSRQQVHRQQQQNNISIYRTSSHTMAMCRCLVGHYFWSSLTACRNQLSISFNGMPLNLKPNGNLVISASRIFNGKPSWFLHTVKLDQK